MQITQVPLSLTQSQCIVFNILIQGAAPMKHPSWKHWYMRIVDMKGSVHYICYTKLPFKCSLTHPKKKKFKCSLCFCWAFLGIRMCVRKCINKIKQLMTTSDMLYKRLVKMRRIGHPSVMLKGKQAGVGIGKQQVHLYYYYYYSIIGVYTLLLDSQQKANYYWMTKNIVLWFLLASFKP